MLFVRILALVVFIQNAEGIINPICPILKYSCKFCQLYLPIKYCRKTCQTYKKYCESPAIPTEPPIEISDDGKNQRFYFEIYGDIFLLLSHHFIKINVNWHSPLFNVC